MSEDSTNEVQPSSPPLEPQEAQVIEPPVEDSKPPEPTEPDAAKPHPLDPDGDRFKQVWARGKKAEERAARLEAEIQSEREERIRLEERLNAQTAKAEPEYKWDELQAAVDAGKITFANAMEIRDQQLYKRWQKEQTTRDESNRRLTSINTEMDEYKRLLPNVLVPGSEDRQKIEREYAYLGQRLGSPASQEQKLSMELAALRAAFGDLDGLRTKQTLASKPVEPSTYMDTHSSPRKPQDTKKDFKSSLSTREVEHYERMMQRGRYPGGWKEVQEEHDAYEKYKATRKVLA